MNTKHYTEVLFYIGKLESYKGNYKEALVYFNKCILLGDKMSKCCSLLEIGKLYGKDGKYNEAKKSFEQLYEIGRQRYKNIAMFELGKLESHLKNYKLNKNANLKH